MTPQPLAPVVLAGYQEGFGRTAGFALYNLTRAIPGHPAGSTVTRETLERAGFRVPALATEDVRSARRAAWYLRNHAA